MLRFVENLRQLLEADLKFTVDVFGEVFDRHYVEGEKTDLMYYVGTCSIIKRGAFPSFQNLLYTVLYLTSHSYWRCLP